MKAEILLSVVISTGLLVLPCAFCREAGQDPHAVVGFQNALKHDGEVENVNVQQLSKELENLIKTVEDSSMACETRNTVVRRLRMLDDALLSGRLSAAHAMAQAWGSNAWWLESAGVLGAQVGSAVQGQLDGMANQIGPGWPVGRGRTKHWSPLPGCESGGSVFSPGNVGGYVPYIVTSPSGDAQIFIKMALSFVPRLGGFLGGLVQLLWPVSTDQPDLFSQLVRPAVYDLVKGNLQGLEALLTGSPGSWNTQMANWQARCLANGGYDSPTCINEANNTLWDSFNSKNDLFITYGPDFQLSGSTDYRLDLLPIYAQYVNLYLGFLRDGVLLHNEYWANAGLDPDNLAKATMAQLLDPNFRYNGVADRGIGYVNSVYQMGLPLQPTNAGQWITWNQYVRSMTLNVLDFRDMWKYLDPEAYPNGVPGGVKLTRMIYSDPLGDPRAMPNLPLNILGPLKEFTVWTMPTVNLSYGAHGIITSVQATSPPTRGPAWSGNIGGGYQLANSASYFSLSARGPIISVAGQTDRNGPLFTQDVPTWLQFAFADGSHADVGYYAYPEYTPKKVTTYQGPYDGEVLATVQVVSNFAWNGNANHSVADSLVFGFRYADSFPPSAEAIGVGSGKCLDLWGWADGAQAVIHSCYNPPTAAQIWFYDPGFEELYAANPTDGSKHCLGAQGGGTAVVISACQDSGIFSGPGASSQEWALETVGAGFGTITNVNSGLVLGVPGGATTDGTGLQISASSGASAQQWELPSPLTGEIHGIGSGRCLDLNSWNDGTQAIIYDCYGGVSQQWTYHPDSKTLTVNSPSGPKCLDARGTTAGTAVQIYTCNSGAGQQWTLNSDGTISSWMSGLVLEVTGGGTADGTLVELWSANGAENQLWSRTSTQGGAVHAVGAGKCLGLPSWNAGTQVVIYQCYATASEVWTYHTLPQTFTVNSPSGPMCLEAPGATAGTPVQINACNGNAGQQWTLNYGNRTIVNVSSGLVLDVSSAGTANNTRLQLMPAVAGDTAQQWVWPID